MPRNRLPECPLRRQSPGTGAAGNGAGQDATTQSGTGPARTAAPGGAEGHSGGTSLKATAAEVAGPSPLLGWGLTLVGLAGIAGVVAARLRKV